MDKKRFIYHLIFSISPKYSYGSHGLHEIGIASDNENLSESMINDARETVVEEFKDIYDSPTAILVNVVRSFSD